MYTACANDSNTLFDQCFAYAQDEDSNKEQDFMFPVDATCARLLLPLFHP